MPAKKFKTPKALSNAWEEYKKYCDEHTIKQFSKKRVKTNENTRKDSSAQKINNEISAPLTYSIEGFCAWCGLSRSAFYDTYDKDEYSDIATRMREECEVDARQKFETGVINPKLAGLWMSKFGYSVNNTNANFNAAGAKVEDSEDDNALLSALNTKASEVWNDEATKKQGI